MQNRDDQFLKIRHLYFVRYTSCLSLSMESSTSEAARKPSAWQFQAIVFFIGIGVMAIEITATRLLAPYFGASLFVWTSLIVTVLLALSIGYWYGGVMAQRNITLD